MVIASIAACLTNAVAAALNFWVRTKIDRNRGLYLFSGVVWSMAATAWGLKAVIELCK